MSKGEKKCVWENSLFFLLKVDLLGVFDSLHHKKHKAGGVCVLATTQQQQQKLCSSLYVQFVFFVFFVGFLCLVVFSFCSIVFLNAARVSSKC